MRKIEFTVRGTPAPKGSFRSVGKGAAPSGSAVNRAALVSWSTDVRAAAARAVDQLVGVGVMVVPFVDVALRMRAEFRMRRPKSHYYTSGPRKGEVKDDAPRYHTTKPDASKLVRATEDDLIGLAMDDDSRIAEHFIRKVYAAPGREGAWICIEEIA